MSSLDAIDTIKTLVDKIYNLDRLERLAENNSLIKIAYAALLGNINYCITHQESDIPGAAIVIATVRYPFTLEGRVAAIAESFRHFSNKLDDVLGTDNLRRLLLSTDHILDVVGKTLSGSKVSTSVNVRDKKK